MEPIEAKLDALCRLGQALILLRDEHQIAAQVLEIAQEVLDFQDSEFLLVDRARQELYVVAQQGAFRVDTALRLPLEEGAGITVAAARSGQPVYVPDVREDPRYVDAGFPAVSNLAVPIQIEGKVLGVINVESGQPDAYTDTDVQLLFLLASQAALALENARHYNQERRRAEELRVVNRIFRRVGATLDLQELLDGIIKAAAELVPCSLAEISLWDEERGLLTLQALQCEPERAFPLGKTYPPGEGYTGWLVRNKEPLLVPNVGDQEEFRPDLLPGELPFQAYMGIPLLVGGKLIGTLVLVHDRAGAFDEADLRLLETLGGQAATVIRNARLYQELARRHRELAALHTVAEAANRPLDLDQILHQALDRVIKVTRAQGGAIRLIEEEQGLVLAAHQGLSDAYVREAERFPLSEEIVGWVARMGKPTLSEDMWLDERVTPRVREVLREVGHRSLAQVPLRTQDQVVGTLGVVAREPGFFAEEDLQLLSAIGHQLGVAVENARLRQQALEAERWAAVGRVAGAVAHDLRSPLGGVIRSAEFLARPELSDGTRKRLSNAIVAIAQRLERTTREILHYARGERTALHRIPCLVPSFLDEVLEVWRIDFSDRGIELVMDSGYTGLVWIDPDRMAQVVYNIAANARDAMPEGGRFTVSTRQTGDWVELRFTDTGPGVPADRAERIFEPFVSYGKREGAGLGLSIARSIVQEHGGSIEVEPSAERGATFVVRLPLGEPGGATDSPPAESTLAA